MIALLIALGAVTVAVALMGVAQQGVQPHPRNEFTGDPRVRDIWEKSRHERHVLIRSMWGDPWAEASWLTRMGRVLSHGFMWVIGVPFVWAALVMTSFFAAATFLTF